MMNLMGRTPLPDGTRLICTNGDEYTIVGMPIGAGGCSIVYSAVQAGEHSRLAVKECYPVGGIFYRENAVVKAGNRAGQHHLSMLEQRMQAEKEYSQKIYNSSICVVKMAHQLELEWIQTDRERYGARDGIFFLMDDIRRKSVSLVEMLEECRREPASGHALRTGGLPAVHVTAKILSEVLNALDRIHMDGDSAGYVHGDIQENNIFFQNADMRHGNIGIACMLDLGCMRKLETDGWTRELEAAELYSTPGYVPPELMFGGEKVRLGVQSDIYSAGRLFLYMLTGKQHLGSGRDRVYYDQTLQRLLPSEGARIGCTREARKLANRILEKALHFEPEGRYSSAAAMRADMERLRGMTAPAKYSMPPNLPGLPTFVGRDRELAQLEELFDRGESPIWIYGIGGMGKSELAIRFGLRLKKAGERDVYRIPFCRSLTETICAIRFAGDEAAGNMGRIERYRHNMDILSGFFKDCTLIIDDVGYSDKGIGKLLRDKAYQELIRQPFTLIFTTRQDLGMMGMAAVETGALQERELLQLMRHFYSGNGKIAVLKQIIHEVGFHTLTVELAARTLQEDRARMTPEQLLAFLKENRLKQVDMPPVMSGRNREYQSETIYHHIQNLYRISQLHEPAKRALAHMLFLVPDGMDRELYLDCEDQENGKSLTECLLPRGWINCSAEGILTMHPLIQKLCLQELEPFLQKEYFSGFLSRITERGARDAGEDYHSFLGLASYLSRTGNWFQDSGLCKEAGTLFLKCRSGVMAVETLREALRHCGEQDEVQRGGIYCDLCHAYSLTGHGRQARLYGRKSLEIRRRQFPYESEEMAIVFNNLGMAYELLGNFEKMLSFYQKALAIRRKLDPRDRVELAISSSNVGAAYEAYGDSQEAFGYYEEAVRICRAIYGKGHPYLAIFCNNAGTCCLRLKDYDSAYGYLSEALEISQTLLPPKHYALVAAYINMANLLEQRGEMERALSYMEEAVCRCEGTEPEDLPLLASCYFNYSYFLDRIGEYPLALQYGKRALEIRQRILPENHPLLEHSYYNLKQLRLRMGEDKVD